MFEDVVSAEIVQRESGGVWLGASHEGKVEKSAGSRLVDVEAIVEAVNYLLACQVPAVMWEKPVVCESVKHRARRAHC